jgi:tetratricopeptide (TPR) repeat protein
VAASHVLKLFEIDFMRCNNETARSLAARRCDDLLSRMNDVDRKAVQRWHDPAMHAASERPLEYVAGVYRAGAGDYESAARLFEAARQSVPELSLWNLELTWLLLGCNRQLHANPTVEDVQLGQEAIRIGGLLERYVDAENADVQRYLGLALSLAGQHAAAIPRLERAAGATGGKQAWEIVAALADSYVQSGRSQDARRVLERAARDPQMTEGARQALARLAP